MPNGGYPLHFAIRLDANHVLRLTGQHGDYVRTDVAADGTTSWVTVATIPAEAIAALVYHVGYWAGSRHLSSLGEVQVEGHRLGPAYSSPACLYDY